MASVEVECKRLGGRKVRQHAELLLQRARSLAEAVSERVALEVEGEVEGMDRVL